ncbi:MAG TPA: hypothetical protein VJ725_11255 [Thermoanaerobaculia bacterium]|nr:hypothetical protein [Thermoanaerobaculia bacterium]
MRAIRKSISLLFTAPFAQQLLDEVDALRKPPKVRRRIARASGPWMEVAKTVIQAEHSEDPVAAAHLFLDAIQRLRQLDLVPGPPSFFVLASLVEFLAGSQGQELTNRLLITEFRRAHEAEIADLLEVDPEEYAGRREHGRLELELLEK